MLQLMSSDQSQTTGPARGFLDRNGNPTTREALIAEQEAATQKEFGAGQTTKLHRLAAKWVWWRTGFTHWSSGSSYTDDPSCPMCRLQRLWRST